MSDVPGLDDVTVPGLPRRRGRVVGALAAAALVAVAVAVYVERLATNDDASTSATDSSAPTASVGDSTTASTTSTLVTQQMDDVVVLRGDGVGDYSFGAPFEAVVAGLDRTLGGQLVGSPGPPRSVMVNAWGCESRSDLVAVFAGLVVGFADRGDGVRLDNWTAFQHLEPTPEGNPPAIVATPEGVHAGASIVSAKDLVGAAWRDVDPLTAGWEWLASEPIATIETDGGAVLVATSNGDASSVEFLTAGTGCAADSLEPITVGAAPIGLQFSSRVLAEDPASPGWSPGEPVIIDDDTHRPTEWRYFGGGMVGDEALSMSITLVGLDEEGPVTAMWGSRMVSYGVTGPGFQLTAVRELSPAVRPFGNWDCNEGMALVDPEGSLLEVVSLDADGRFVSVAPEMANCIEIMGD